MNNWKVISRFRKSGNSWYEVSNGEIVKLIKGYRNLLKLIGEL